MTLDDTYGTPPEIDAKIQRGIAQLDRGEGIPEDELGAYLARLKTQPD